MPREVVAARTARPVAYVPLGTLERHGEHDCVGLDGVKADALAVHLAERGGGLAFLAQFWGDNREYVMESCGDPEGAIAERMGLPRTSFAPGAVGRPGYMDKTAGQMDLFYVQLLLLYVQLLLHMLRTVDSLGFRVCVLLAGHYGLRPHAESSAHLFAAGQQQRRTVAAWVVTGFELVRDAIPDAGDHAGKWETSLLLALRPDCVDLTRLPADPALKLLDVGGGRPAQEASAAYGWRAIDLIAARVHDWVDELLRSFPRG